MPVKKQKFKIWWDDKEKIVRLKIEIGVLFVDKKMADEIYEGALSFFSSRKEKTLIVLVDLGKSKPKDVVVRKILYKTIKIKKIGKIAFIGLGIAQRVIVNFITQATGKKNSKHFSSEEEALLWLKK